MANDLNNQHLSAERIQAFLEGELPGSEVASLEEHASSCARCQAELEAWGLLFSELDELPSIAPPPGFRERVLDQVPVGVPVLQRLKGWLLGGRQAAAKGLEHLSPERLQDYVEGLLPAGQMARVRSHLEECGRCRRQEAAWRSLFTGLETLPRVQPSPGFAQQVMDRVQIPSRAPVPATPSLWDRAAAGIAGWLDALRPVAGSALAMARTLQPRSRRAWAMVGSVVAAPAAVVAAGALYIASNPLLSMSNLFTFLWWKTSEATAALGRGLTDVLLDSSVATQGYALADQLTGSLSLVAGTAAVFCVLTVLSLYVLYRNLIATRPVDHGYVHLSF